ncbi:MAG: hypothetical protein ABF904_09865 [Ethanoligenens sp.]
MEKFIFKEKMSKKARRALDQSRRGTWGTQSPITRTVESKKIYNRKKDRWDKNPTDLFCGYIAYTQRIPKLIILLIRTYRWYKIGYSSDLADIRWEKKMKTMVF